MNKPAEYLWDEERGMATCILYYKNLEFKGVAFCHPEDKDMQSKLTGQTIAEWRAMRKYFRHMRDNELKPQLKALKQLYYAMNRSKEFDPKSYQSKMLYRHIQNNKTDLDTINNNIATLSQNLTTYISDKDKVYQSLRKIKQAKDN